MTLAIIFSRASCGIDAPLVTVEVHISNGLPSLAIVGLPETAVKESRDRVRSALINNHFEFPVRRITVNLAPADLPKKNGGRFDLPIALGILAASQQIPLEVLAQYEFAGELALDGTLRGFSGALPFSLLTSNAERKLVVPLENADEAALPKNSVVLPARHLLEVCSHLLGRNELLPHTAKSPTVKQIKTLDIIDIYGQIHAKRALAIAAAGQHSMIMVGPPGTGKTMLASRLPSILPPMSDQEAIESAAIHSICGKKFDHFLWQQRPFRAPHHTASSVALVGGSSPPRPGEISLAHHGVLFLDELPEFSRHVLESLREPMESGCVTISRAAHQAIFPARFQLIAAMNPCPCGNFGNKKAVCRCTQDQIQRYRTRISGPLLDRIDLYVEVASLPSCFFDKKKNHNSENSQQVQQKVIVARNLQMKRADKTNAFLDNAEISDFCQLADWDQKLLEDMVTKANMSARAYHRVLKVARTIADFEDKKQIDRGHLAEALSYRYEI